MPTPRELEESYEKQRSTVNRWLDDEAEACAKVAEGKTPLTDWGEDFCSGYKQAIRDAATAIRKRIEARAKG